MQRNRVIRETELLRRLRESLSNALPPTWSIVWHGDLGGGGEGPDASFTLNPPDLAMTRVLVEAKRTADPRDVRAAVRQLASYRESDDDELMLVAPYLSVRAREVLQESGAGWFDATGNLRLQLARPALFIDRVGASRNPFRELEDRRLKSLKGPGAARVVRALLDSALPLGVRALAEVAEVGAGTSSRVIDLLVREDVVERNADGRVTGVKKDSLVRRWTEDYGLASSNQPVPMLAARGIEQAMTALRGCDGTYAITAEAAARVYLSKGKSAVAPVTLLTVFVPNAVTASEALSLRPVQRGANVMLVEPFDRVVFRRTTDRDQLTYAAASQVVADLLTGTARAPEQAVPLLESLADHDDAWSQ